MPENNLSMLEEFFEDYVPENKTSETSVGAAPETVLQQPTKLTLDEEDEAKAWAKKAKEKREAAFAMIQETAESIFKSTGKMKLIDYLIVQSNFPD